MAAVTTAVTASCEGVRSRRRQQSRSKNSDDNIHLLHVYPLEIKLVNNQLMWGYS